MSLAVAENSGGGGLHLKIGKDGFDFSLSDEAISAMLSWATDHPYLFMALLLFLGFGVLQWRFSRRENARMKMEYEQHREKFRQPSLPLPDPKKANGRRK